MQKFKKKAKAWEIGSRRARMRYLVENLAANDEVCACVHNGNTYVTRSAEGRYVIPIWPDEECFRSTMLGASFHDLDPISLNRSQFSQRILADMQDDELLAVFPDRQLEYELFERDEMLRALEYRELHWKGMRRELSESDRISLAKHYGFNDEKND